LEEYVNESCLVFVNHQSDADPLVVLAALRKLAGLNGKISVVLEDIFNRTHFGIMMRLRGDIFIHQGRDERHLQAEMIQEQLRHFDRLRDPRWCILFPEGGFLYKRKQRNMDFAKKNGYPVLENVLLPRLGAVQALVQAESDGPSGSDIVQNGDAFHPPTRSFYRRIIDITIAYPDGKPVTLLKLLLAISPLSHIALHFRVKNLDHSCVSNENELRKYMYDLWTEKDQLLQQFYERGHFPDPRGEDLVELSFWSSLKGYAVALPVLALDAFCIWTCISYVTYFVMWVFKAMLNLVY